MVTDEPAHEAAHAGLMRLYALLGQREKALGQYERLLEARWAELEAKPGAETRRLYEEISAGRFPPDRSPPDGAPPEEPTPNPHNLPMARTSFVGRERELIEVKRALAMTRLLTLTGAGGSGKTRLALEVAGDLVGAYPDGAWLVELAPLSEGALVPGAVAGALGVREQPNRPLTATLVEALSTKNMILVLDNCEHLIDASARLADALVGSCPRLRVLATSREALNVAGETSRLVPSLSLPGPEHPPTVEELEGYESARLFVERALYRPSAFVLTSENARAVAEVCRKLDGIPLAIELAAARVGALAVEQISERLSNSLKLLSGGSRTATPRQRTLRGALDWSYELLAELEKRLFHRLSVFAGGWTLQAAEAVGAGSGIEENDVLDLLSRLVDKSMVVAEANGDDALRYRMLEPVRQYGLERLEESGESKRVRLRHAEYCLALAEEAEPELRGPRQGAWLKRLEWEHGNLRAALQWSLEGEDAELGLRLAGVLERFWWVRGHLSEGRRWLERGLAGSGKLSASARAKALNEAGWMTLYQGDLELAVALLEESLSLFRELGDEAGVATSLHNLGHAVLHHGDKGRLKALCEVAEGLRRELVDRWVNAELLIFLGMTALHEGDYERAVALLEESLALFWELGDMRRVTICLPYLWLTALEQGDYERAIALLEENLRLLQRLGIKPQISYCLLGFAAVAALLSRPDRAARLWGASEALREAIGLALPLWDHTPTDYEGHLAATRSRLGDVAFEEAWTVGKALTQQEAVEYALLAETPVPTPPPAARATVPEAPSARVDALTPRQKEVAYLVARGLSNRRISSELFISERTVETHIGKILKKLGLASRTQLTAWMIQRWPLPSEPS